ncbi:MAG: hypothetical protein NZ739_01690 [Verrucomicrobiae bacterium]|nr:hypothetical protein [Verrucomicrobiae bacterium]MDW7980976.1 hypothetical protein [Verrucomicrobiales bacterium]
MINAVSRAPGFGLFKLQLPGAKGRTLEQLEHELRESLRIATVYEHVFFNTRLHLLDTGTDQQDRFNGFTLASRAAETGRCSRRFLVTG